MRSIYNKGEVPKNRCGKVVYESFFEDVINYNYDHHIIDELRHKTLNAYSLPENEYRMELLLVSEYSGWVIKIRKCRNQKEVSLKSPNSEEIRITESKKGIDVKYTGWVARKIALSISNYLSGDKYKPSRPEETAAVVLIDLKNVIKL